MNIALRNKLMELFKTVEEQGQLLKVLSEKIAALESKRGPGRPPKNG